MKKNVLSDFHLYNESVNSILLSKENVNLFKNLLVFSSIFCAFAGFIVLFQKCCKTNKTKNIVTIISLSFSSICFLLILISFFITYKIEKIGFPNYDNKCIFPYYGHTMKQSLNDIINARTYQIIIMCLWVVMLFSFLFDLVFLCINKYKVDAEKMKALILKEVIPENNAIN